MKKNIYLYSFLASLFLFVVAFLNPPFLEPDSFNHFYRAYQIESGHLIGERFDKTSSGGEIPSEVADVVPAMGPLLFDFQLRYNWDMEKNIDKKRINSSLIKMPFPNTVVYAPWFYVTQVTAIFISKGLNLSVLKSVYLMRVLTAALCLAMSIYALTIVPDRVRFWLFFVLCLPETMMLYASISYDAVLSASLVLMTAFLCRSLDEPQTRGVKRDLVAFYSLAALVVAAKPPYFPILLFPLILSSRLSVDRSTLIRGFLLSCIPFVVWFSIGMRPNLVPLRPGNISTGGQLSFLGHHPGYIFTVIKNTVVMHWADLTGQSIGTIRWTGTVMPRAYYESAVALALILGALMASGVARAPGGKLVAVLVSADLLMCISLISLSIYLSWDEVGTDNVWGINGRYFTSLVAFMALLPACYPLTLRQVRLLEGVVTCLFLPFSLLITLYVLAFWNWIPVR